MAFGDSITEGKLRSLRPQLIESPPFSYPFKLQQLLESRYTAQKVTVFDEGFGGETVNEGVARLPRALASDSPEVLLLQEGANDLNQSGESGIRKVVDGLRTMVQEGRKRGLRVFVATLLPMRPGAPSTSGAPFVDATNALIRAMAPSEGAVVVDLYQAFDGVAGSLIGGDGLHPSEAGYSKIAETYFEAIRTRLEVP
jgi:lysophospholipase L1-like esterase